MQPRRCRRRRRPPLVVSSSSTLVASATVMAMVGRWRPPLATLSSLASAVGRQCPPFVASLSLTLVALATVMAMLRWRRTPLATALSLTPASSLLTALSLLTLAGGARRSWSRRHRRWSRRRRSWPWWDCGACRSWPCHRWRRPWDDGGTTAPAVCGLVVVNVCRVDDGRGRDPRPASVVDFAVATPGGFTPRLAPLKLEHQSKSRLCKLSVLTSPFRDLVWDTPAAPPASTPTKVGLTIAFFGGVAAIVLFT